MRNPQTHPGSKTKATGRSVSSAKPNIPGKETEQRAATANSSGAGVSAEERHRQIAEAAYYRAMRRGFHGGADLEDWLESEAEIDKLIWRG